MRVLICKSDAGYVLCIATGFILALQHCYSVLRDNPSAELCSNRGDIRLQNGTNKFEGRVEVCGNRNNNGNETLIWKTVCNAGWDTNEAMVVCRQLGFSGNLNPIPALDGTFNDGSSHHIDNIIKKNFTCRNDEEGLLNCTYYNRNSSYCNESQLKPAGVYCFGRAQKHCNAGEIRLSNGTNNASGQVEVCLGGLWGTVCDDGWDSNDATTVCRQLGYNHTKGIPTRRAYFGEGSGPIHLSIAQCRNNDTKLTDCMINKTGINGCTHSEDAGVICMGNSNCEDFDVQLVGGEYKREGRVEICFNGAWGTVCDYGLNGVDASVVCRQLGFNFKEAIPTNNSYFGAGDGPVLLDKVSCNQSHSSLSHCVDLKLIGSLRECEHTAGVICVDEDAHSPNTMTSMSTKQVPTTILYATTTHDSTYKSHDTTSTASVGSDSLIIPAILGTMSAVLVIGVIAVTVIITMAVVLRRRTGQIENSDHDNTKNAMDNPTYDANTSVVSTTTRIVSNEEDESLFQNPLYSDVGHNLSKNSDLHHPYEDIKMDALNSNEARDIVSDSCYSALEHNTEYSTLEPHIPKSFQEHLFIADDYQHLHHK